MSVHAESTPSQIGPDQATSSSPRRCKPGTAWAEHAEALADWTLSRLVVRKDVWGGYHADGKPYTGHGPLTKALLIDHFRGKITIGVHSTSTENRCLTITGDVDAHDADADPEVNWRSSELIVEVWAGFRLRAMILDSNGKGGYHVKAFFKKSVPAAVAYWLGELTNERLEAAGLPRVEFFPKQEGVELDTPYGNWARLPGKHHKREHWTRIWDPTTGSWLEEEAAVRALIRVAGDDTKELLEAFKADQEAKMATPQPAPKKAGREPKDRPIPDGRADSVQSVHSVQQQGEKTFYDFSLAAEALRHVRNMAVKYKDWLDVGMSLRGLGDDGLMLWDRFSRLYAAKYEPGACAAKWATFSANGKGDINLGSLFKWAKEAGWEKSNGVVTTSSVHSVHSVQQQWGEIKLGQVPPAVPFPVRVFPEVVSQFCRCVAISIGCPIDLPGGAILAVASAAIGRSMSVLLKPGYFGTSSLWIALIGPPSDGKSPALEAVARPIREIDESYHRAYLAEVAQWELARDIAKKCKQTPPKRPIRKCLDVDDITIEALQRTLCENPRGVGWFCDELATCVLGMNQYKPGGKGNDRPTLCKMWGGKPTKRDRAGEHSRTPYSHLSLAGGMVPDMLGEMKDRKGRADGFLERYLFIFPAPTPLSTWCEDGIDDELAGDWKDIVDRLHDRTMAVKDGRPVPHVVLFDTSAKAEFVRSYDLHIAEMNAPDFLPSLRGPWGKFRELAARIALVLACLRHASNVWDYDQTLLPSIRVIDIQGAWDLIGYFKANYLRVKATIEGDSDGGENPGLILNWLRADQPADFSERDLYQEVGRFRHDRDAMAAALEWLRRKNVIRVHNAQNAQNPGGGRTPSPRWAVNPALYAPAQNAQNAQKGREPGSDDDLGD
jgi:hypothetical protein